MPDLPYICDETLENTERGMLVIILLSCRLLSQPAFLVRVL